MKLAPDRSRKYSHTTRTDFVYRSQEFFPLPSCIQYSSIKVCSYLIYTLTFKLGKELADSQTTFTLSISEKKISPPNHWQKNYKIDFREISNLRSDIVMDEMEFDGT